MAPPRTHGDASDAVPADAANHPAEALLPYPLRGLAGEGADALVRAALAGLAGVRDVRVRIADALAHVTYDPAVVTAEAIDARLHTAGRTHTTDDDGSAHGHPRAR